MDWSKKSALEIVEATREALTENDEWKTRYADYAKKMKENLSIIKEKKSLFNEFDPLFLYMTIGEAKSTTAFQLRYRGQIVADLYVENGVVSITTDGYDEKNRRDFDCSLVLKDQPWRSQEAQGFRKHFANAPIRSHESPKGNEEHRLESLLLSEFEKTDRISKRIVNIQPVSIAAIARFQMKTPFSGSKLSEIKYSTHNGGGIDILARIGIGKAVRLCVMEVKDENKKTEPPYAVIRQALLYATFIRELLRSESGAMWWELFGFTGAIPRSLSITVACVMPHAEGSDLSFDGESIGIDFDTLKLRYMYFKETDNVITEIKTSIPQCAVSGATGLGSKE